MADTETSIFDKLRSKPPISRTGQHAAPIKDKEERVLDFSMFDTPQQEVTTPAPTGERVLDFSVFEGTSAPATEGAAPITAPTAQATATAEPYVPAEPLTVSKLYEDERAQKVMRDYFVTTLGESVEGLSNEEVADMYVNRMRMWNAGNSMTVVGELYNLTTGTQQEKDAALAAYDLWDNTASMFSSEATWGDTFDGVADYAWATIADPTNIAAIAGGAGIATRFGTKGAAMTAKVAAKAAAKLATEQAVTKGAKSAAARVVGEQAYDAALRTAMKTVAYKEGIKKTARTAAIAEFGVDAALTLGVDYAYQQGMILSGKQEDYSAFQGGLTALGVLGGNMLSLGLKSGSKLASKAFNKEEVATVAANGVKTVTKSSFSAPDIGEAIRASKAAAVSTPKAAAKVAAEKISVNLDFALRTILEKPLRKTETWSKKVAKGKTKLALDQTVDMGTDDEFFEYLILGSEELGVTGILESLLSSGVNIPGKKAPDEGITDFLTDVFLNLPDEYAEKMAKSFRDTLGKKSPDYNIKTKEDLSNFLATKMSSAGRNLSVMARARKLANTYSESLDIETQAKNMGVAEPTVMDKVKGKLSFLHNLFLRTVTAHPSTTILNMKGQLAVFALDDMSDVVRTAIHYGAGFVFKSQKEQAAAIAKNLKFRYSSYLDPRTTIETFNSFLTEHADIQDKMYKYMVSGADVIGTEAAFKKQFGFDMKDAPVLGMLDKYANAAQVVYGAKAVDNVTKAMAFIPNLDKQLRLKFGSDMGLMEFYGQEGKELFKKMRTSDYQEILASAFEDTGRQTLSLPAKSWRESKGVIDKAAYLIENVSKIPFIGTILPFGRFFNGTVRVMADFSGVNAASRVILTTMNAASKIAGGDKFFDKSTRSTEELIARGVVGWTAAALMAQQYGHDLKLGLSYGENVDSEGNLVSRALEYPENFFRYAAALMYYAVSDEEMPEELAIHKEGWKTFGLGQITRNLSEEGRGIAAFIYSLTSALSGEEGADPVFKTSVKLAYEMGFSNYVTALTRPLDPINHIAAMSRGDDYAAPDRKQGHAWLNETMRYTDQIFAVLTEATTGTASVSPAKEVLTRKDIPLSPLSILSERIAPPRSVTEKMFNKIGRALYDTNVKSYIPEANNAVNEAIQPYIEARMKVLDTPAFDKLELKMKQNRIANALTLAKKDALNALRGTMVVEDARMALLFDMSNKYTEKELKKGLAIFREAIGEGDLYDLNTAQLNILSDRLDLERERVAAP